MTDPPGITNALPLEDLDLWRFGEGTHDGLAHILGANPDPTGCSFRVWAPAASAVSVIGAFNDWAADASPLQPSTAGIWSGRVTGAAVGDAYKYRVVTADGMALDKADPVGFATEEPPRTASRIWSLDYSWGDDDWMAGRGAHNAHDAAISIYELHLGSWRYEPGGYRGLAPQLADHLDRTGFTHVELLPVMEHPFYGSWGYQTTGYFAPTARYGAPQDLMYLIDLLHQRGYGVILDWVPSHFPTDAHGLANFDGTHLYEHADPRLGFHPDWRSAIFNYDRHEVRSFLLSSAQFWLERYHADGLRVDAVASMLYRDYSRTESDWLPNEHGGRENLGAIAFLRELNRRVYLTHPDVMTIAEESTAWPGVSKPTDSGGLGFGFKWDMGWMNDTLQYLAEDPVHRSYHHDELTFRMVYAFDENFVLPLSHDEVVHGKGSLLARQPGDEWQRLAGLRLLLGYQYAMPGKKLLFMGAELAMEEEWNHERELPWELLADPAHAGVADWVARLNEIYRAEPAL
ncbi:MAG: 1,4-alpha-glucan branching protein GlgB, partial [Acidimicrobiales bacterium]